MRYLYSMIYKNNNTSFNYKINQYPIFINSKSIYRPQYAQIQFFKFYKGRGRICIYSELFQGDVICPNKHLGELRAIEPYLKVIESSSALYVT